MTLPGSITHQFNYVFFFFPLNFIFFFRFIQWGTCCCSGAEHFKLKEENGLQKSGWCRDEFVKHPVNTLACKKLANLPSVIPLYSGYHYLQSFFYTCVHVIECNSVSVIRIHGDVVTSRQPVWAVPNYASSSDDVCLRKYRNLSSYIIILVII